MSNKPIVLVTGATGAQGGSVAAALLKSNKYIVRCLTRNAGSEKALLLQQKGAEIVQGNLDDIDSLKKAVKGCYAVFGTTNSWEHFEKEYELGKNLVNAVGLSGVQHFVFSTLPDYCRLSKGRLPVAHCDGKAALQEYTKQLGIPATFVHVAFYYQNFLDFFPPQKNKDGNYYFGFPQGDTKLAMVNVEDLGGMVSVILDHPQEYIGRTVGAVGEDLTCTEYAAIITRVLNQNVYYNYIPRNVYAAYRFAGAEELANMFEVQRLHIPNRLVDMIESYGLNPSMQRFESWLQQNRHRFPMAAGKLNKQLHPV